MILKNKPLLGVVFGVLMLAWSLSWAQEALNEPSTMLENLDYLTLKANLAHKKLLELDQEFESKQYPADSVERAEQIKVIYQQAGSLLARYLTLKESYQKLLASAQTWPRSFQPILTGLNETSRLVQNQIIQTIAKILQATSAASFEISPQMLSLVKVGPQDFYNNVEAYQARVQNAINEYQELSKKLNQKDKFASTLSALVITEILALGVLAYNHHPLLMHSNLWIGGVGASTLALVIVHLQARAMHTKLKSVQPDYLQKLLKDATFFQQNQNQFKEINTMITSFVQGFSQERQLPDLTTVEQLFKYLKNEQQRAFSSFLNDKPLKCSTLFEDKLFKKINRPGVN